MRVGFSKPNEPRMLTPRLAGAAHLVRNVVTVAKGMIFYHGLIQSFYETLV
jgi:hypothetical protein